MPSQVVSLSKRYNRQDNRDIIDEELEMNKITQTENYTNGHIFEHGEVIESRASISLWNQDENDYTEGRALIMQHDGILYDISTDWDVKIVFDIKGIATIIER